MVTVSSAWQSIYDAISSNVSDPLSRGEKWIFGSYPDVYAKDFPGFPIIVIQPVSKSEKDYDVGTSSKKEQVIVSQIEIYSKSASQADSLVDSVLSAVEDVSLYDKVVERVEYSFEDVAGSNVHVRVILVRWVIYA